jgi:hypothetical protein
MSFLRRLFNLVFAPVKEDAALIIPRPNGPSSDPEDVAIAKFSSESDALLDKRVDP